MRVYITSWATDSYFELVVSLPPKISRDDYKNILRPDIELLLREPQLPLRGTKFQSDKFWGLASSRGKIIPYGYKMKWHNFGDGKFQLRLCIAIIDNECFLCRAYIKNDKSEKREMANF